MRNNSIATPHALKVIKHVKSKHGCMEEDGQAFWNIPTNDDAQPVRVLAGH